MCSQFSEKGSHELNYVLDELRLKKKEKGGSNERQAEPQIAAGGGRTKEGAISYSERFQRGENPRTYVCRRQQRGRRD